VLFRSVTLSGAAGFYGALLGFGPADAPASWIPMRFIGTTTYLALAAGIVGAMPLQPMLESVRNRLKFGGVAEFAALSCVFLVAIAAAASETFHPFIYFRF